MIHLRRLCILTRRVCRQVKAELEAAKSDTLGSAENRKKYCKTPLHGDTLGQIDSS